MDVYEMEGISFLLYAVMIVLGIWNYKNTSSTSLRISSSFGVGLIIYQFIILKQQMAMEEYIATIASRIVCVGIVIYVIGNMIVYYSIKNKL